MGNAFNLQTPATSFGSILHTNNLTGLSGGIQQVVDGSGTDTALRLSATGVDIVSGLMISGVAVTSTAAEINKLDRSLADGFTESSKAMIMDATGSFDMTGSSITRANLLNYRYQYKDLGVVLSSGDITMTSGHLHEITLIGSPVTLGFQDAAVSGNVSEFLLLVRQDSTGGRSITWPGSVDWYTGNEPALDAVAYGETLLRFQTNDGGTRWIGHEIVPRNAIVASGQTLDVIYMRRAENPSSSAPQSGLRNSHLHWAFDDTISETGIFPIYIPNHYNNGGIRVTLVWAAASATSDDVQWNVAFERMAPNDLDIDSNSFDAAKSVTTTTSSTAGKLNYSHIYFATSGDMDDIQRGEAGRLQIVRAFVESMIGDAQLYRIELREMQ